MKVGRFAPLPLVFATWVALASCASDGGGRGTGVTTAQGNVSSVESTRRAPEPAGRFASLLRPFVRMFELTGTARATNHLENVRVVIEETGAEDWTDPNGHFVINGEFGGRISIVFHRPEDGVTARVALNAPTGGVVTLSNVRIDGGTGDAEPEEQRVEFEGLVTDTNCRLQEIALVPSANPSEGEAYRVRVDGELRTEDGRPMRCEELESADSVAVAGDVAPDGTIEADEARVEPRREEDPPAPTSTPTEVPTPSGDGEPGKPSKPTPAPDAGDDGDGDDDGDSDDGDGEDDGEGEGDEGGDDDDDEDEDLRADDGGPGNPDNGPTSSPGRLAVPPPPQLEP